MPERTKTVDRMTRAVFGLGSACFNGLTGELHERYGVSMDDWDLEHSKQDALFEDLVRNIDWTRILIESVGRHLAIHPEKQSPWLYSAGSYDDDFTTCGVCVQEVLLSEQHLQAYERVAADG